MNLPRILPALALIACLPAVGAAQHTPEHDQGFVGELLAIDWFNADDYAVLHKPPRRYYDDASKKVIDDTTHPGGFDIVAYKNGVVYVIDNKAYSRPELTKGGKTASANIGEVSAFSQKRWSENLYGDPNRDYKAKPATSIKDGVVPHFKWLIENADPSNKLEQQGVEKWKAALQAIEEGKIQKVVTNARALTSEFSGDPRVSWLAPVKPDGTREKRQQLASNVTRKLANEGVMFIDVRVPPRRAAAAASATSPSPASRPARPQQSQTTVGRYLGPSPEYSKRTVNTYKSIPGGVLLEGTIAGIPQISRARYDAARNTLILNEQISYQSPVSPESTAAILGAIARDDRVGATVSGLKAQLYGALAMDTDVGRDLVLADFFLGEIVFPENGHWTAGYRFANDYKPQKALPSAKIGSISANFVVTGFQGQVSAQTLRVPATGFEVRYIPHSKEILPGGESTPDLTATGIQPEYAANGTHLAENIAYYRRERIVDAIFKYGEVAALARTLKQSSIDLDKMLAAAKQR